MKKSLALMVAGLCLLLAACSSENKQTVPTAPAVQTPQAGKITFRTDKDGATACEIDNPTPGELEIVKMVVANSRPPVCPPPVDLSGLPCEEMPAAEKTAAAPAKEGEKVAGKEESCPPSKPNEGSEGADEESEPENESPSCFESSVNPFDCDPPRQCRSASLAISPFLPCASANSSSKAPSQKKTAPGDQQGEGVPPYPPIGVPYPINGYPSYGYGYSYGYQGQSSYPAPYYSYPPNGDGYYGMGSGYGDNSQYGNWGGNSGYYGYGYGGGYPYGCQFGAIILKRSHRNRHCGSRGYCQSYYGYGRGNPGYGNRGGGYGQGSYNRGNLGFGGYGNHNQNGNQHSGNQNYNRGNGQNNRNRNMQGRSGQSQQHMSGNRGSHTGARTQSQASRSRPPNSRPNTGTNRNANRSFLGGGSNGQRQR